MPVRICFFHPGTRPFSFMHLSFIANNSRTYDHRDDLDEEEYIVTKRETEEQLSELRMTLGKMKSGNMTLIDSHNENQLVRL